MERKASDLATFIVSNQRYFKYFVRLIHNSAGWDISNLDRKLEQWKGTLFIRRNRSGNIDATDSLFIEKIVDFFKTCRNTSDIGKARGTAPEKLAEKIFFKKYEHVRCNIGVGCVVILDNTYIKYRCDSPFCEGRDCDGNKETVDVGIWDGNLGEFLEVKVKPDWFQTKDVKYLNFLRNKLNDNRLNFKIHLVCLDDAELIKKQLVKLGHWGSGEFNLIGTREFMEGA